MIGANGAAITLCLMCAVLISLRAELLRPRLNGYLDAPVHVRWAMHGLSVLLVARAYLIWTSGGADVSEAAVYVGIAFASVLQVGAMVKRAWCGALDESKAAILPDLKEAVKEAAAEAVPGYLQTLHRAPADYGHGTLVYPEGQTTPVDVAAPRGD